MRHFNVVPRSIIYYSTPPVISSLQGSRNKTTITPWVILHWGHLQKPIAPTEIDAWAPLLASRGLYLEALRPICASPTTAAVPLAPEPPGAVCQELGNVSVSDCTWWMPHGLGRSEAQDGPPAENADEDGAPVAP